MPFGFSGFCLLWRIIFILVGPTSHVEGVCQMAILQDKKMVIHKSPLISSPPIIINLPRGTCCPTLQLLLLLILYNTTIISCTFLGHDLFLPSYYTYWSLSISPLYSILSSAVCLFHYIVSWGILLLHTYTWYSSCFDHDTYNIYIYLFYFYFFWFSCFFCLLY